MKQLHYLGALLLCSLLTVGCTGHKEKKTISPVSVNVTMMQRTHVSGIQEFSGTVEEMNGSVLSFPIGGTLTRITVNPGQRVRAGELLAVVNDVTLRNGYDVAVVIEAQAKDAYQRMKTLHDNGSLPEIKWVEVQSKYKQAIAATKIARKSLSDCKLYAPYSGVISTKNAEVGQNLLPGMPVVKLVKIDDVKIKIAVPENEIARIKKGQTVSIRVSALGDRAFEGRIVEKGISANALSRSYDVKALVSNNSGELMPGMICKMYLDNEGGADYMVLPNSIIQIDENNRNFVWINNGGKAQKRQITIGQQTDQGVIISSGLNDGDEVIVKGMQKVSEGTQIRVIR